MGVSEQFSAIVEAVPTAIVVVDGRGVIVLSNAQAAEMFGYAGTELAGQPVDVLVPSESRSKHGELLARFVDFPSSRLMGKGRHLSGQAKDGAKIPIEIGLRSMTLPEGTFVVCAITDISARIAAESAMVREHTGLETILRAASDGIHILDADGLLIEANDAFLRMLGYDRSAIGQLRVVDWNSTGDWGAIRRLLEGVMDSDSAIVFETRHRTRSATEFDVEISACAIDIEGQRYIYASARDISDRKLYEQKLQDLNESLEARVRRRTEELAQVNRTLEAFSSSVSHDLRAPLRAIEGFARIIQQKEAARLSADGRQLFARIEANATKLGQLLEDTLQFTRIGRYEMKLRDVDMTALAKEAAEGLSSQYPAAQVAVAQLPNVSGDVSMLRQVWANLIGNALKYSSKADKPRVAVGYEDSSAEAAFFVRDNGAGFDMQHASKLFEAFQRFHSEQDFAGTGTGLAIVKRIVERHGGRIWAQSSPGDGATFRFTIGAALAT